MKIKSKSNTKSLIKLNDKVTWIDVLPGGDSSNYSVYHETGNLFGVVVKIMKKNAYVNCKNGDLHKVLIEDLTNIEDLF